MDAGNGKDCEAISDIVLAFLGVMLTIITNDLIKFLMEPDMIKTAFACELHVKKVLLNYKTNQNLYRNVE